MDDKRKPKVEPYKGPAGGWGSLKSVGSILAHEKAPLTTARELMRQNKADGFMCFTSQLFFDQFKTCFQVFKMTIIFYFRIAGISTCF